MVHYGRLVFHASIQKKTAPEKIRVQIPPHETKDLWQHQSGGDLIKKMAQSEQ